MLGDHTIVRLESHVLTRSFPRVIGRNSSGRPHGREGKVRVREIHTDQGATGWAYSPAPDEMVEPLIGRRLSDLFDPDHGAKPEARVLDLPLHDLAGKILGQPVWRMLGAVGGQTATVYAGGVYFDDLDPDDNPRGIEGLLDVCAQDADAGHAHFKLKIGRGYKVMDRAEGDARDVEVTRRVRERYPDAKILVDANDGYTPEGMLGYFEQVADCNLYWIEEPFVEETAGLRKLRDAIEKLSPDTLLADGENRNGRNLETPGPLGKWTTEQLDELYAMSRDGLLDVLLMDVGAMGFSAWRDVMPDVKAAGAEGSPHAWGEPLKTLSAAVIACGLGNVSIVEGVPGKTHGVDDSAYKFVGGELTLPDKPGFGLELDL